MASPVSSTSEPRERRNRSDATRERILDAARLLFRTKGYSRTATSDIASEAGVAEGSIFYHFGTKRNLLATLGQEFARAMVAAMRGNARDLATLDPGIMIERAFDFAMLGPKPHDTLGLTRDDPEIQPFLNASRDGVVHFIEDVMRAWHGDSNGHGMHIPVAAGLCYAAVHDSISRVLDGQSPYDPETVRDECIRFIRAAQGLRPGPMTVGIQPSAP